MNRKQREKNRHTAATLTRFNPNPSICDNCGEPGSHFAPPPCFGQEGFYMCEPGLGVVNEYGNPVDGRSMPYCNAPDCGCPESRLCMAEGGAGCRP